MQLQDKWFTSQSKCFEATPVLPPSWALGLDLEDDAVVMTPPNRTTITLYPSSLSYLKTIPCECALRPLSRHSLSLIFLNSSDHDWPKPEKIIFTQILHLLENAPHSSNGVINSKLH